MRNAELLAWHAFSPWGKEWWEVESVRSRGRLLGQEGFLRQNLQEGFKLWREHRMGCAGLGELEQPVAVLSQGV